MDGGDGLKISPQTITLISIEFFIFVVLHIGPSLSINE